MENPIDSFYNPDLSKARYQGIITLASEKLEKEIQWGVRLLFRSIQAVNGKFEDNAAIFLLYRHIIETTDSINVLIKECCTNPAQVLLRSSFEALLSLEYIFEDDTIKRSLACYHDFINSEIAYGNSLMSSTSEGKELKKALSEDKFLSDAKIKFDSMEVSNILKNCKKVLEKAKFEEYNTERELLLKKSKWPKWFRYFNGPKSIKQLSKHLKGLGRYLSFYPGWSRVSHAIDFSQLNLNIKGSVLQMKPIRNGEELLNLITGTSICLINSTLMMVENFRSGERDSLRRWYIETIKPINDKLYRE